RQSVIAHLRYVHDCISQPNVNKTRTVLWGVIGHQDNAKVWPLLVGISELLSSRAPHEIIGVPAIFPFDGDEPVEWCIAFLPPVFSFLQARRSGRYVSVPLFMRRGI